MIANALFSNFDRVLCQVLAQAPRVVRYVDKPAKHPRQIAEIRDFFHNTMWIGTLPVLLTIDSGRAPLTYRPESDGD